VAQSLGAGRKRRLVVDCLVSVHLVRAGGGHAGPLVDRAASTRANGLSAATRVTGARCIYQDLISSRGPVTCSRRPPGPG
jgi:hypothetical protein